MIVDRIGAIVPGFHALSTAEVPSYLLDASRLALFDAGFACLGPSYAQQARPPAWLFLTHVHFDHCGSAAYLLEAFPGLTAAASARAAQIVTRPGTLDLMARLNRQAVQTVAAAVSPGKAQDVEFQPFRVDRVLDEGQELDLDGGLTVQVLATPGHTWDFLSYYIPQKGILICSEASGCAANDDHVVSEFLVDYQAYLGNLERSRRAAGDFRAWVDGLLDQEHGQVDRVVARVKAQEYDPRPHPKQLEPAYLLNLGARVSHLVGLRPTARAEDHGKETA